MSLYLVPRSLWYIEQVARLGSIQAASRELGISASAIHRQIKTIEDAMGEPLFERDACRCQLKKSQKCQVKMSHFGGGGAQLAG